MNLADTITKILKDKLNNFTVYTEIVKGIDRIQMDNCPFDYIILINDDYDDGNLSISFKNKRAAIWTISLNINDPEFVNKLCNFVESIND